MSVLHLVSAKNIIVNYEIRLGAVEVIVIIAINFVISGYPRTSNQESQQQALLSILDKPTTSICIGNSAFIKASSMEIVDGVEISFLALPKILL